MLPRKASLVLRIPASQNTRGYQSLQCFHPSRSTVPHGLPSSAGRFAGGCPRRPRPGYFGAWAPWPILVISCLLFISFTPGTVILLTRRWPGRHTSKPGLTPVWDFISTTFSPRFGSRTPAVGGFTRNATCVAHAGWTALCSSFFFSCSSMPPSSSAKVHCGLSGPFFVRSG
jgi:hypothetical protein